MSVLAVSISTLTDMLVEVTYEKVPVIVNVPVVVEYTFSREMSGLSAVASAESVTRWAVLLREAISGIKYVDAALAFWANPNGISVTTRAAIVSHTNARLLRCMFQSLLLTDSDVKNARYFYLSAQAGAFFRLCGNFSQKTRKDPEAKLRGPNIQCCLIWNANRFAASETSG